MQPAENLDLTWFNLQTIGLYHEKEQVPQTVHGGTQARLYKIMGLGNNNWWMDDGRLINGHVAMFICIYVYMYIYIYIYMEVS